MSDIGKPENIKAFMDIVKKIDGSGKIDVKLFNLYRDLMNEFFNLGHFTLFVGFMHQASIDRALTLLINITKIASAIKMVIATARSLGILTDEEASWAANYIENHIIDAKNKVIEWVFRVKDVDFG